MTSDNIHYQRYLQALKQSPFLKDSSVKSLESLLGKMTEERWISKNFKSSLEVTSTFHFIISGKLKVFKSNPDTGREHTVFVLSNGDVVKIESIGLRTSKALNRDDISIIIPNSLITTSKVINWSHQTEKIRFRVNVRAAYGGNVDQIIKILEESAFEHPEVTSRKLVEARLTNFGNSSLDFELLFFSKNIFRIEKAKSDIRRIVSRKFTENLITIPFPQMDLHVK